MARPEARPEADDPVATRLRAALACPAAPSSDHDLNPGQASRTARALRPAAVLIGVVGPADAPQIVLTKRSSRLRHHPGQIAFPGGKQDAGDTGAAGTALREAHEEVGLDPAQVRVLGALPPHETVTGFAVVPVLARITGDFDATPEAGEVAEVFRVPLAHICDLARYRIEGRRWRGQRREFFVVPFGPYYIWGATARILRGLADQLAR
jgi:8-oxo-dGTP pyrophosphatase MutT (NUDIX family)